MPSRVRIFFGIIVVVAAYWIVSAVWHLVSYLERPITHATTLIAIMIGTLTVQCLVYLIPAWLAAYRRLNWARWMFVAVVVAMQILSLWEVSVVYLYSRTERFREIGQIILRAYLTNPRTIVEAALLIAAIFFVFTGNARDWFKNPSTSNSLA